MSNFLEVEGIPCLSDRIAGLGRDIPENIETQTEIIVRMEN